MNKIIQLYSDKNKTIKAYPKTLASQVYMDDGQTTITSQLETNIQEVNTLKTNKVDKVQGKGLSTNDYDNTEKGEVAKVKDKADLSFVNDRKRDKSVKIDTSDLTEKVLQQIAGTASVNSIPADKSVTPYKTTFFKLSQNIFNKNTVTNGYLLDVNFGGLVANASYSVSDFIPVSASTQYIAKYDGKKCFYDKDKKFISGSEANGNPFTTPSNANFVRITIWGTSVSGFMLCEGATLPQTFIPFGFKLDKNTLAHPFEIIDETDIPNNSISTDKLKNSVVTLEKIEFFQQSLNLFNRNACSNGYVDYTNGNLVQGVNYYASDFIKVEPSTKYSRTIDTHMAFYDSAKKYISGVNQNTNNKTFTTPSNAIYCRFSIYSTNIIQVTTMFVLGDTMPSDYVPYGFSLKPNYPLTLTSESETLWKGKKWITLGDSITAPGTYQNYVRDELLFGSIINKGVAGQPLESFTDNLTQAEMDSADLVTLYGALNNMYPNAQPLGTVSDLPEKQGATFISRLKYQIEKVLTLKPTVKLVIIGTHNACDSYRPPLYGEIKDGKNIGDYVKGMGEVARYYGLHFIDMYAESGFNNFTLGIYTNDKVHPNDLGYKERIAPVITNHLKMIQPY